jgi:hypothetical protein
MEKIEGIVGRNYAKAIKSEETVRVRVGNEWNESVLARGTGVADRTANYTDSVAAKGNSTVHIGLVGWLVGWLVVFPLGFSRFLTAAMPG